MKQNLECVEQRQKIEDVDKFSEQRGRGGHRRAANGGSKTRKSRDCTLLKLHQALELLDFWRQNAELILVNVLFGRIVLNDTTKKREKKKKKEKQEEFKQGERERGGMGMGLRTWFWTCGMALEMPR